MNSRQQSSEIKHVNLQDSVIWFPKTNCLYHLKSDVIPSGEVTISFTGDAVEEYGYLDLSCAIAKRKEKLGNDDNNTEQFEFEEFIFISRESLPPNKCGEFLSPIQILQKKMPSHLLKVMDIQVHLNKNAKSVNISGTLSPKIKQKNHEIQKKFQKAAGNIPVTTGQYPIYIDENRPDFQTLESLYQNFICYNKDKLKEQYQNSQNLCHIRAHFISTFLNGYGISTVKLYKIWNIDDWKSCGNWIFHCATMIIDKKNQGWVWDPWVYFSKNLLTLDQWLNRANEPVPVKLLITNHAVVSDFQWGRKIDGAHFMELCSTDYVNSFQALAGSALPNPPVNRNQFFKSYDNDGIAKKRAKISITNSEQSASSIRRL